MLRTPDFGRGADSSTEPGDYTDFDVSSEAGEMAADWEDPDVALPVAGSTASSSSGQAGLPPPLNQAWANSSQKPTPLTDALRRGAPWATATPIPPPPGHSGGRWLGPGVWVDAPQAGTEEEAAPVAGERAAALVPARPHLVAFAPGTLGWIHELKRRIDGASTDEELKQLKREVLYPRAIDVPIQVYDFEEAQVSSIGQ